MINIEDLQTSTIAPNFQIPLYYHVKWLGDKDFSVKKIENFEAKKNIEDYINNSRDLKSS